MIQIIKVLSEKQQLEIREYLNSYQDKLQTDVSRYAVGRQCYWIEHEAKLLSQGNQVEEVVYEILPGAVVLFNCKNPHRVVRCDDTRYSINLWSIARKCQTHFDKYLKSV